MGMPYADFGRPCPGLQQITTKLVCHRPDLGSFRAIWSSVRPMSGSFRPKLGRLGQISGWLRPTFVSLILSGFVRRPLCQVRTIARLYMSLSLSHAHGKTGRSLPEFGRTRPCWSNSGKFRHLGPKSFRNWVSLHGFWRRLTSPAGRAGQSRCGTPRPPQHRKSDISWNSANRTNSDNYRSIEESKLVASLALPATHLAPGRTCVVMQVFLLFPSRSPAFRPPIEADLGPI